MIKAAAAQIAPHLLSRSSTIGIVLDTMDEAHRNGANFIVFPETFIPYYPYFSFISPPVKQGKEHLALYEQAVEVPSEDTQLISKKCKELELVAVVGINERDHGSLYNTQLFFDADGTLLLKRRKITPSYHERMIWGQGDGAGLKVVATNCGRVGGLACWEHYNPLARYALMTQHEEIHAAQFPGSMVGPIFSEQIEVTMRHHALESGCFVVNATGWLREEQIQTICPDESMQNAIRDGCMTCIISPEGRHLVPPITKDEGILYADLDFNLITKRKRMLDSVGHYARPELLSLNHNIAPAETRRVVKDDFSEDSDSTHFDSYLHASG
jgi:aliphatic nitrilase